MNFYAHAVIAETERADADFVLGAMLPDLAAMAGLRIAKTGPAALRDGVRLHHASDHAFHGSPVFGALLAEGGCFLRASGVRRGPARAAAHVGIELLLDGWLVTTRPPTAVYDAALARALHCGADVHWLEPAPEAWQSLCRRITAPGSIEGYTDPLEVARRTARVLQRRPRLALERPERRTLAHWLSGFRARVARHGPALLDAARAPRVDARDQDRVEGAAREPSDSDGSPLHSAIPDRGDTH